jgi:hypothetical protein
MRLEKQRRRHRDKGELAKAARLSRVIRSTRGALRAVDEYVFWRMATRGRTLSSVAVRRQVVRGRRARVYFSVTYRDGTVLSTSEPMVLKGRRWRLKATE